MYAVIAQNFNSTAEFAIPTGTTANEANAKFETQPLTAKMKTRKSSKKLITLHFSYAFHSLNHYVLLPLKDNFLFNLFLSV